MAYSEVISRLKWAKNESVNAQNALMGYDCRIKGPKEKMCGGDILEHRIQYFRSDSGLSFWRDHSSSFFAANEMENQFSGYIIYTVV
jgi:hypothetical protein